MRLVPGTALVALLTAVSYLLARVPLIAAIGPLVITMFVGMGWRGVAGLSEQYVRGTTFAARDLLRVGIVLLGVRLDFGLLVSVGPAVVLGSGGRTGGFHTTGEWIELEGAWLGAQRSLLAVLALVGVEGTSEPLLPRRAPRTP